MKNSGIETFTHTKLTGEEKPLIFFKRIEKNKINKRRRNNLSIKRLYLLQRESTLSNA